MTRRGSTIRRVIWFLRHGDAAAGDDDFARPLTEKGERQSQAAGATLAALGVAINACVASPRIRALETARLACQPLGVEPEADDALAGGRFDPIDLAAGRGNILLVGHEPDFSQAVFDLTGARVEMKKGGLAAVEDQLLRTLLTPAQTKRLG